MSKNILLGMAGLLLWNSAAFAERESAPGQTSIDATRKDTSAIDKNAANGLSWWHEMFSLAFDGHGNFVAPHLDTLNARVASVGAVGFYGIWDADLNRDMPWMRGNEKAFANHPEIKRLVYIEGAGETKVLARVAADGRVLFTEGVLSGLDDPQRLQYVDQRIRPGGRTVWLGTWQFLQGREFRTALGQPLPTAADLGLPPFTHPLTGAVITDEAEFWRTRSARPLLGPTHHGLRSYRAIPDELASRLELAGLTQRDEQERWLVRSGEAMLYDGAFARYQTANFRRVVETLAPDMVHYDDWDLRSPTLLNARADIHLAAFRRFVREHFDDEQSRRLFGVDKAGIDEFDVFHYLLNPPWRGEYDGRGSTPDGPAWMAATDPRWLADEVWRTFQIACVEDRLAAMREIYRTNRATAREMGRDVPMVANIIPTLSAAFLQRDCVDMANFEWPNFKTYGALPRPFGHYPDARLGLGPRMAAKIGTTGHAMVDPYVEVQHSGWDGAGFTRRHGETLHEVIAFDLLANRGIPAFALTYDGGFSPGSVHSASRIHQFINEASPVLSRREFIADIGLAVSSWSQLAAQTPFGGWNHEVSKRHLAEFVGWAQHLMTARDFPQWDLVPFDHVTGTDLERFRLVILPSVLVVTADQRSVLKGYLAQGGRLLVTGETGTFGGPRDRLLPQAQSVVDALAVEFPDQVVVVEGKPGVAFHLDPSKAEPLRTLRQRASMHRPVLTAASAPEQVALYLSRHRDRPGEITVDLVNHDYDLDSDKLTPVTAGDFTITLDLPDVDWRIESLSYDPSAPNRLARAPLAPEALSRSDEGLEIQVPPYTHYRILRLTPP